MMLVTDRRGFTVLMKVGGEYYLDIKGVILDGTAKRFHNDKIVVLERIISKEEELSEQEVTAMYGDNNRVSRNKLVKSNWDRLVFKRDGKYSLIVPVLPNAPLKCLSIFSI